MKLSLAELYSAHPFDHQKNVWRSPLTLDASIEQAGDLHLQNDPLTYLEDMQKTDDLKAMTVNNLLLGLPPEVVIEELGYDTAMWTSIENHIMGEDDKMNSALHDKFGIDIEYLETAQQWLWRQQNVDQFSTKLKLAQYGMMQAMRDGVVTSVDLAAILHESTLPGVTISESRVADYSLQPIEANYNLVHTGGRVVGWDVDTERRLLYSSWLDAPTGFALMYRAVPNAIAGVAMTSVDEMMTYQLQGVRPRRIDPTKSRYSDEYIVGEVSSKGLAPFDWQKLMIGTTEAIAEKMSLQKVAIQAAHNNVWTKKRLSTDHEPHLPIDRAIKIYDASAQRLGYERTDGEDTGNWHKNIK